MPQNCLPRISILTPSFNQGRFIEENIRSVMQQDYPNIEHIVIDGGSSDGTIDILRKYPQIKYVSERDKGQADALNKGLAMATGDVIGWINSDDYYEPQVLASVGAAFQHLDTYWLVGDLTKTYPDGRNVAMRSPPITYAALLENPDIVRQQSTFFSRTILDQVGGWDSELYMTMDFDLWVRIAKLVPPKMVQANLAYFRMHADQKSTSRNLRVQYQECDAVLKRMGAPLRNRFVVGQRKRFYLLKSYVKRALVCAKIVPLKYANRPIREN